jgi:hypothetical protein
MLPPLASALRLCNCARPAAPRALRRRAYRTPLTALSCVLRGSRRDEGRPLKSRIRVARMVAPAPFNRSIPTLRVLTLRSFWNGARRAPGHFFEKGGSAGVAIARNLIGPRPRKMPLLLSERYSYTL